MGALLGGGTTKTIEKAQDTVKQTVPEPDQTAEATPIGDARAEEDTKLFGDSQPDFRVDRPAGVSNSSVGTSGSGLKLM
jgi:hypothetical protein